MAKSSEQVMRHELAQAANAGAELRVTAARFDAMADKWADRARTGRRYPGGNDEDVPFFDEENHPDAVEKAAMALREAAVKVRQAGEQVEAAVGALRHDRDQREAARHRQGPPTRPGQYRISRPKPMGQEREPRGDG